MVAKARVIRLGDGRFIGTGSFYRAGRFELGPMARVAVGSVEVLMASRKQQAADQAMFRHLGVEPGQARVLQLKSSVHFRADFGPIADQVLVVEAPGPNTADPGRLPFTKLPAGRRRRQAGAHCRAGGGYDYTRRRLHRKTVQCQVSPLTPED